MESDGVARSDTEIENIKYKMSFMRQEILICKKSILRLEGFYRSSKTCPLIFIPAMIDLPGKEVSGFRQDGKARASPGATPSLRACRINI